MQFKEFTLVRDCGHSMTFIVRNKKIEFWSYSTSMEIHSSQHINVDDYERFLQQFNVFAKAIGVPMMTSAEYGKFFTILSTVRGTW